MSRSLFLELLDEEASLKKGAKGAFENVAELGEMLQARAALVRKIEAARSTGQITPEQHEQLIVLNRKHSLPKP